MHELSVTQSIVAICAEHAAGARVLRVRLQIGRLAAILPDAVRFCFDLCTDGTVLQDAQLEIIEIPGRAVCCRCGAQLTLNEPFGRCDCGSTELTVIAGQELRIEQMEVL
ncbi:MAG TPA: hydrogenase maturation nickel metallochaperone HypA [Steroidobacteraceae bacterium]|jgi:hydrogenase nickel incorporation protein HypA/HybF|nr:hydrogenase maturation nickel metallochaperone HypA [Steroidobacteraceae bacterium]